MTNYDNVNNILLCKNVGERIKSIFIFAYICINKGKDTVLFMAL